MIIAGIFEKLFSGMELTYNEYSSNLIDFKEVTKAVQFGCGDSKELSKWLRGRNGKEKYPLIWYIIEPVNNSNIDTVKNDKCCLLLFTSTKPEYYNNTRALINYSNILEPLTQKIFGMLESNKIISLIFNDYESYYTTFDIPNYGVDDTELDWKKVTPQGTKSITIDIVDARKIEFHARFNKGNINC